MLLALSWVSARLGVRLCDSGVEYDVVFSVPYAFDVESWSECFSAVHVSIGNKSCKGAEVWMSQITNNILYWVQFPEIKFGQHTWRICSKMSAYVCCAVTYPKVTESVFVIQFFESTRHKKCLISKKKNNRCGTIHWNLLNYGVVNQWVK